MRKKTNENRQITIFVIVGLAILAILTREGMIAKGWSTFNANIAFGSIIAIGYVLHQVFQEFIAKFLVPKIDRLFRQMGFSPKQAKTGKSFTIDYASSRQKIINRQEQRMQELEQKVICYIIDTMSAYVSQADMERLIQLATEFFHINLAPDFKETDKITLTGKLTTTDLLHFGWNIAKPFRKPGSYTALFLKQVFADVFSNTEVYTMEKKLCSAPLQGTIKINRDIVSPKQTQSTSSNKKETIVDEAMHAAFADMAGEGILIEDDSEYDDFEAESA